MKSLFIVFLTMVWLATGGADIQAQKSRSPRNSQNPQNGQTPQNLDVRGQWDGKATGEIFGAEGKVVITYQNGEDIIGVVEGGNIFGTAKFDIAGKVRGNFIYGTKDGHTFQGYLYPDYTIRGMFQASTGDKFQVFLRRPNQYWGGVSNGSWQ
jgi:hypothetical protein